MLYGWAGKILYIDLSTGKVVKKPSDEYVKAFIGLRGVNAKLLYDLSKPGQSAFNPETPIIFGTGALAGTGVIGASKMEVTSRNPAEEPVQLYGNVGMGGSWSPELKFAGYDNVVVTGRANKPTYIFIDNNDVLLKDAKGVWGKGTFETPTVIREAATSMSNQRNWPVPENRSNWPLPSCWELKRSSSFVTPTRPSKIHPSSEKR